MKKMFFYFLLQFVSNAPTYSVLIYIILQSFIIITVSVLLASFSIVWNICNVNLKKNILKKTQFTDIFS